MVEESGRYSVEAVQDAAAVGKEGDKRPPPPPGRRGTRRDAAAGEKEDNE